MAASNRAGATSDEIMVRPVIFGSMASFITSGMEAAGGLWVGQLVIAFVPGLVIILVAVIKGNVTPAPFIVSGGLAPVLAFGFAALFNFTAGYWLAASLILQPQISSRSLFDRRRYLTIPVLGLLQLAPQPQTNETFGE